MADICVLGLGYIGLPTAALFAVQGLEVVGVDTSARVVDEVNSGQMVIDEVGLRTLVEAAIGSGRLSAKTKPEPADTFIIAVPTPLTKDNTADLSYVESAARSILGMLRPGNLVVLESTVSPGTTDELLCKILAESGLQPGKDLFVAHCPERVLPGRILTELVENDRIIGGIDEQSGQKAAQLYSRMVEGKIIVTSAKVAELTKLSENSFRDVNIAFANELAMISRQLGVAVGEVISLANRHPRVNILQPGPGVGGHCIPVDPWFIVEAAPETARIIRTAREVNDAMPAFVVRQVQEFLSDIPNPKVCIWGLAYKSNVGDAREAPSVEVIHHLEAAGIKFSLVDFHVKSFAYQIEDVESAAREADCILLLTDHKEFHFFAPEAIGKLMRTRRLLDTRNTLDRDRWQKAGFEVRNL
jgi:UDP-N-acetyl-D-mannosaminuronic acid dehydrogenase